MPYVAYTSWFDGLATAAAVFCTWTGAFAAGDVCVPHPTDMTASDVSRHTSALRVLSTWDTAVLPA
jgi:hypothetical protein